MTNTTNSQKSRTAAKTVKAPASMPAPASAKKTVAKKTAPNHAVPASPARVKHKLVRDSFTIPKSEYVVLESLKHRAADLKRPVKKSELLRAGISALSTMSDKAFLAALSGVPSLKTGRPSKSSAD